MAVALATYSDLEIAVARADEEEHATPSPRPPWHAARFRECSEILYYVYVGTLLVTYTPLIGLVQVKFQNGNMSPFKTHSFFMVISVVALVMATLTLRILFYINNRFEKSNEECSSPIHHIVLINVAWFSTLLAPLSLVLVLFIPTKLIWIGYSLVCALFAAIVASNFVGDIYLLGKMIYASTLKLIISFGEKF